MKIVLTGGTGFLGRPLATRLAADGHQIFVLTRSASAGQRAGTRAGVTYVPWTPDGTAGNWAAALEGAGAAVNLAGESIADSRWTEAHKARIRDSRVRATRSLVSAIARLPVPPRVLVSGSAVGYYGDTGDRVVTEASPPGSDFLASVTVAWEQEALQAEGAGVRVALLRTGIVLARDGGALAKLLPPFRLFVGGPLGSGRQYWPWIHRDDWIEMATWLLARDTARGPFNATAPSPVTNAEFARTLGDALGRPSALPAPAFAMRLLLGEMADAMLLGGQRVLPERALSLGFRFKYETLDQAFNAIFRSRTSRVDPQNRTLD
jgi:uncharacterized protein (TIGR01777 family)